MSGQLSLRCTYMQICLRLQARDGKVKDENDFEPLRSTCSRVLPRLLILLLLVSSITLSIATTTIVIISITTTTIAIIIIISISIIIIIKISIGHNLVKLP